jgi:hypothetical protein
VDARAAEGVYWGACRYRVGQPRGGDGQYGADELLYAAARAGAESFRRAWEAALDFGIARLKDIAFERAVDGYLVPVFVAGKLMGFRRRHNDALLMFCLRHYGQEASGKRTTINYFSTRASAGAGAAVAGAGEGGAAGTSAGAMAEASTTTVRTVIHGGAAGAGDPAAGQDAAAALLDGFDGVALDAQAQAEIDAALLALAERQRALIAAADEGGPDAIAMQVDDPGVGLVRVGEQGLPFYGPMQAYEGLADADPVQRFAGEADWVEAGGDIPEGYLAWIEGAEARGERTPAVPLPALPAGDDGVAEVRKRPSRHRRPQGEGAPR